MRMKEYQQEMARKREIPLGNAVCPAGTKEVAAELKRFPFAPRTISTVLSKKDLMPLWKILNQRTAQQSYWAKIVALWLILEGEKNPVRIVAGQDRHWWIEMDFPEGIFIFDWNAYWYSRQKESLRNLGNIRPPSPRKGEIILILDRERRDEEFAEKGLYLIENRNNQTLSEQFRRSEPSWLEQLMGFTPEQFRQVREMCQMLQEEFEEWRSHSPSKRPKL